MFKSHIKHLYFTRNFLKIRLTINDYHFYVNLMQNIFYYKLIYFFNIVKIKNSFYFPQKEYRNVIYLSLFYWLFIYYVIDLSLKSEIYHIALIKSLFYKWLNISLEKLRNKKYEVNVVCRITTMCSRSLLYE